MKNVLTVQDLFTVYKKDIERMGDEEFAERPLIIRNAKYRAPDGTARSVLPEHYSSVVFEPDWMVLTFAEEQDKKALYNIFYNKGMRVPHPMDYNKDQALVIYRNTPRALEYIEEPDVIIDNDLVEINMKYDPSDILQVLDIYLAQKKKLLERSGPDGI